MTLLKILIPLAVGLVLLVAGLAYIDASNWAIYARDHHCRMVRQSVVYMPVMVGHTLMPQPITQTTYACDDGVEITR